MHAYIHQPYIIIHAYVRMLTHCIHYIHACILTYIRTYIHERMHQTNKHTLKQRNNKLSQQQNNETTKKAHTSNKQTGKHANKQAQKEKHTNGLNTLVAKQFINKLASYW